MINLSGKNINVIGSFVYVYTTKTYMKNNWYKIGGTDVQSVSGRVVQQDTTSTAEEPIVMRVYELGNTKYDGNSSSAELFLRKGLRRTRKDRDREWRIVDLDVLDKKAERINKDITKVDIELLKHPLPKVRDKHLEAQHFMMFEWCEDHKDDRYKDIFDYIIRPNDLDYDFTSVSFEDFLKFLASIKVK